MIPAHDQTAARASAIAAATARLLVVPAGVARVNAAAARIGGIAAAAIREARSRPSSEPTFLTRVVHSQESPCKP